MALSRLLSFSRFGIAFLGMIFALAGFFSPHQVWAELHGGKFSFGERFTVGWSQAGGGNVDFVFSDKTAELFDVTIASSRYLAHEANGQTLTIYLTDGGSVVFRPLQEKSPFLRVEWVRSDNATREKNNRNPREKETLETLEFPPIKLSAVTKTLSTAGLKPASEEARSYAFIAAVNHQTNRGLVAGWLTSHRGSGVFLSRPDEKNQFLVVTPRLDYGRLSLESTDDFTSEAFVVGFFDDVRDGLEAYAAEVAKANNVRLKSPRTGYCSWYSDKNGGAGNEETTAEFARVAREKLVPYGMNFFQIDDKWQEGNSKNGPNKNFTAVRDPGPYHSGLKKTADLLEENGLTCGIWFMPFSGNFDDPYFADKQDLFVRSAIDYPKAGEKNTRTYSSINQKKNAPYETFWGGTCLDATNPNTIRYIEDVTHRLAHDWNCRYFKVDGLWTGMGVEQLYVNDAYKPDDLGQQIFYDKKATNVEAYVAGLSAVRRAAGDDVVILGCNVSQNMRMLLPSVGLVDAMRIGPDNGSDWKGICAGPWRGSNRYFLNGRVWWNDPDPVYVRDSIPLSHAQVITSWAALTGQLYAFSDWLPDLSAERVNVLRKTIPGHGLTSVRPVDLFTSDLAQVWTLTNKTPEMKPEEARWIVGLFNWKENDPAEFNLSPEKLGFPSSMADGNEISEFVVYNFWDEKFEESFGPAAKRKNLTTTIPGGSCAILAVRPKTGRPTLLSTSRNITQGIYEVISEDWNAAEKTLTITVDPKKAALGEELPYELRLDAPKEFGNPKIEVTDQAGATISTAPPTLKTFGESQSAVVFDRLTPDVLPKMGAPVRFVFRYGGTEKR